ncbi:MAG: hypothetical protein FJX84_04205 [Bacteroidetes bacterium]|nr:hypothetical protein [Bacteroidota bacterium]
MKAVIFIPILLVLVISSCKKRGCTDPNANNYNSSAEQDNGTCTYTISDIEGNTYNAKEIGNQIWMTENLKVKRYRNGDIIPQIQDPLQWSESTTGAWCYYENDTSKGVLYNWHAVNDSRGLAPVGHHIPSDAEWTILTDFLGGEDAAGTKMKSTSGWEEDGNGTNSSGFSGLPGGYRYYNGTFTNIGYYGCWWSSMEGSTTNAWDRSLICTIGYVYRNYNDKRVGVSVRCLRD